MNFQKKKYADVDSLKRSERTVATLYEWKQKYK